MSAYIGSGMSGQVIYPAIPCESGKFPDGIYARKHVSKVMSTAKAAQEFAIAEQLRSSLSPEALRFALLPEATCKKSESHTILYLQYGGMTVSTYEEFLEDIIEDSVTAKDYLRIGRISEEEFIEVFRALEALIPYVTAFNAAGFYHNDLLGSNIVFDSMTKMAYVIDFERLTSGTGRTDDIAYLRRAIYYLGKTFCAIPKDKLSHGGALTDGICAEIAAAVRPVVAPKNKLAWMKTV